MVSSVSVVRSVVLVEYGSTSAEARTDSSSKKNWPVWQVLPPS